MMHFRLRKPDALDDRESLHCDNATIEGALADFGHQLGVVLELDGDVMDYVIFARPYDKSDFRDADGLPVTVVRPKTEPSSN